MLQGGNSNFQILEKSCEVTTELFLDLVICSHSFRTKSPEWGNPKGQHMRSPKAMLCLHRWV